MLFIIFVTILSCNNKQKYTYIEIRPDGESSKIIESENDSTAYERAFSYYLISKFVAIELNSRVNNNLEGAKDFKLLRPDNFDISRGDFLSDKNKFNKEIAERVFNQVNNDGKIPSGSISGISYYIIASNSLHTRIMTENKLNKEQIQTISSTLTPSIVYFHTIDQPQKGEEYAMKTKYDLLFYPSDKPGTATDDSIIPDLTVSEPLNIKAKITSIADGYDIERVNLWSSTSENRVIIDHCLNNEDIIILEYSLPYVKIKKKNGSMGWVMDGFIKK